MKFKPNKLTTFMFSMLEILAPFCVGIPVMILMGNGNYTANDILSIFPTFIVLLVLIVIFCCVLNLITLPFTKHTVFLYDRHFSRQDTEVRYDNVTRIEIDSGAISRFGGNEPCCLDCYSGEELLISIEHPSLLMSFLVWRRCKNAKLRYKRVKRLALIWAFVTLVSVALGLLCSQ